MKKTRARPQRAVGSGAAAVRMSKRGRNKKESPASTAAASSASASASAAARLELEGAVWSAACAAWQQRKQEEQELTSILETVPHRRTRHLPTEDSNHDSDHSHDEAAAWAQRLSPTKGTPQRTGFRFSDDADVDDAPSADVPEAAPSAPPLVLTVDEVRIDACRYGVSALKQRNVAHEMFMKRNFAEAALKYSLLAADCAGEASTVSACHYNSAVCQYMSGAYPLCIKYCRKASGPEPHQKADLLQARAYLIMGDFRSSENILKRHPDGGGVLGTVLQCNEQYVRFCRAENYAAALRSLSQMPAVIAAELPFQRMKMAVLIRIDAQSASGDIARLLLEYPEDIELLFLKAQCIFFTAQDCLSLGTAKQILQKVIQLRSHAPAVELLRSIEVFEELRSQATLLCSRKCYTQARDIYTQLLGASHGNERLRASTLALRAATLMSSRLFSDAIADYRDACSRDPANPLIGRWLTNLAKAYQATGDVDTGIRCCEEALAKGRVNPAAEDLLSELNLGKHIKASEAEREERERAYRAERDSTLEGHVCLYSLLGAAPRDTQSALKAHYRKLALLWHPDKWSNASTEQRSAAEVRFKAISHAYTILADKATRHSYDLLHGHC